MRRTTIFLSEELHEQLRHDAFQSKVSSDRHSAGHIICPVLSDSIDETLYGR